MSDWRLSIVQHETFGRTTDATVTLSSGSKRFQFKMGREAFFAFQKNAPIKIPGGDPRLNVPMNKVKEVTQALGDYANIESPHNFLNQVTDALKKMQPDNDLHFHPK